MISETFPNNVTTSLEGEGGGGKTDLILQPIPKRPPILSWRDRVLYCEAYFGVLVQLLLKDQNYYEILSVGAPRRAEESGLPLPGSSSQPGGTFKIPPARFEKLGIFLSSLSCTKALCLGMLAVQQKRVPPPPAPLLSMQLDHISQASSQFVVVMNSELQNVCRKSFMPWLSQAFQETQMCLLLALFLPLLIGR